MKSTPTDEPTTTPEPIAASTDSKKARAKKVAAKEPISYMLLIRVTCGDKNIVEESSMECLQELESTFDYGKELQKQRVVVVVKIREIKAPQSALRLESRAKVVAEGRGNTAWRTIEEASDWLEVEKLLRGFAAMGRKQMQVSLAATYSVPPPSLEEGGSNDEDDELSGDEEHPTGTGTSSTRRSPPTPTPQPGPPAKKTRRTATVVEVEKAPTKYLSIGGTTN